MKAKVVIRDEYAAFANLLRQVIRVPHSEIQAKLKAEKDEKRKSKTSASVPASNDPLND